MPDQSKFVTILKQREPILKLAAAAAKLNTVNSQFTLRGFKISDKSLFVKSFSSYEMMEQWLTTFESSQYDFG